MDELQRKQFTEALVQVALIESKAISVRLAEIIAYLQKQEYLVALGIVDGFEEQFMFLDALLKAAARINYK